MVDAPACSGFPHSVACVKAALDTGEPLCPEPKSISSPTVVQDGRVVIEGLMAPAAERVRLHVPIITNLLRAGQIVGLDPREMVAEALAALESERAIYGGDGEPYTGYTEGSESGGCA